MLIVLSALCLISAILLTWTIISIDDFKLVLATLLITGVGLFLFAISDNPTVMDVYQNKTTLKYTIIDGVKTDSVVVWKKEFNN